MRRADPVPRTQQPRQNQQWELDAEDLDRYMSGQPSREPRFDPYGRPQSTGRTERAQPRSQSREPQYGDQPGYEEDVWAEDDYSEEFNDQGYDAPVPTPPRTRSSQRRPTQAQRPRPQDPEHYDDDLYEDPYVMDDDDAPQRPQRPDRRAPRARQRPPRPAAGFTLPPAITNAPILKDRITLGMIITLVVSLVAMIIVVATRRDLLDAFVFTHVNANGEPENVQGSSAVWRMPLIAGMVALINGTLAWFLTKWGMFLPRFLLGGAVGVHFIIWVAIFAYFF